MEGNWLIIVIVESRVEAQACDSSNEFEASLGHNTFHISLTYSA